MKKTHVIKSLLCLLLSLLMLFAAVSCTNSTGDLEDSQGPLGEEDSTDQPSQEELDYKPSENYYNRTLTFMARSPEHYEVSDDLAYNGTVLDNAVWERAAFMWDEFGVEMIVIAGNDTDYQPKALAGDYVCDYLLVNAHRTMGLALQDLLVDFNSLESLNLEASYWDSRIQEQYKIGDRLYTLEGDYTYYDEFVTTIVKFNNNLYTDYGYYEEYGSPYDLVRQGKWTLAVMESMYKDLYVDLNNNSKKDLADSYGLLSIEQAVNICFYGSGLRALESNDGELTLNIGDGGYYGRFYDIVEDCVSKLTNKEYVFCTEIDGSGVSGLFDEATRCFAGDRALFQMGFVESCVGGIMGEMKSRFGILPIPAYEEGAKEYYALLPSGNHRPLAMAYGVKDREETAEIMEILCYYSRYGTNTIYEAYFETFRLQKMCNTADDLEMLELIENSKCYDFAGTTKVFNLVQIAIDIEKAGHASTLASTLATTTDAATVSMATLLETMARLTN